MTPADDLTALATAPKALLHDHLDGGLRPATIIELADDCGWTPNLPADGPGRAPGVVHARCRDRRHPAVPRHVRAHARGAADGRGARAGRRRGRRRPGRRWRRVRRAALRPRAARARSVRRGRSRRCAPVSAGGRPRPAGRSPPTLICCAMRTGTRSLEIAELVDRMREVEPKVVGFDLAGAETGFPPSLHAEALSFARRRHLNVTLHASEPPDLELIDDAHRPRRPPDRPRRTADARHDAPIPTARRAAARAARPSCPRPSDPPRDGADVPRPGRRGAEHRRASARTVPARRILGRGQHRQPADERGEPGERARRGDHGVRPVVGRDRAAGDERDRGRLRARTRNAGGSSTTSCDRRTPSSAHR